MRKVLLLSLGDAFFGGVEKNILEWVRNIHNRELEFDILALNDNIFKYYEDEIKKLGCNIYNLKSSRTNYIKRIKFAYRLYKFLKKNKYDVIHINSSGFYSTFILALISRFCNVHKIIIHSQNYFEIGLIKRCIINILNPIYRKVFDVGIACSEKAINVLFTKSTIKKKKCFVLKNGIDVNKYKFDENIRQEYREKLKLENKIVYGHIGRFVNDKNHIFLINLFYEIQKIQKNAILLLIGDGELKGKIEEKVKHYNLEDKVIFLGFRDDCNKILNCMDIFLFPSKLEAFGLVVIEVQANGLDLFCSNEILNELKIMDNFYYFDLKDNCKDIAIKICNSNNCSLEFRKNAYKMITNYKYDIKKMCDKLEKIYIGDFKNETK